LPCDQFCNHRARAAEAQKQTQFERDTETAGAPEHLLQTRHLQVSADVAGQRCPKRHNIPRFNPVASTPNLGAAPLRGPVRSLLGQWEHADLGDVTADGRSFEMNSDERIFVIEADQVIRSALGFILSEDRETYTFSEIDDALTKAAQLHPDAVLLGIGQIERHGAQLVAELMRQLRDSSIILVADTTTDPLALAGLNQGAQAVIGKPITFEGVSGKVDAVLAARPSAGGLASTSPAIASPQLSR
jgi:CheY-like chemotaxis protein